MSTEAKKLLLIDKILQIEDERDLDDINSILKYLRGPVNEELAAMLRDREEKYLTNKQASYSWEDVKLKARQAYKNES